MAIRLATSALSKTIYAGHPNKAGNGLREPRYDVTSDALKAVIDKIGPGNTTVVEIDGVPTYEISVHFLTD